MQVARLQRSCHRLIWLNPLIGTLDFAPLTRGLQAALPFVDDFLPVRTLRDIRDLASRLAPKTRLNWCEGVRPPFSTSAINLVAVANVTDVENGGLTPSHQFRMDITGSYRFTAPPESVWDLMMDPKAIAACIPGCEELVPDGPDRYRAKITIGMAAITGTYEGVVVITEKVPNSSYRLAVEGQGRPGFVKGSAAHYPSPRRRRYGGRSHRHGADRRRDRTPRSAPDWLRREDDAGPLLRLHAGELP